MSALQSLRQVALHWRLLAIPFGAILLSAAGAWWFPSTLWGTHFYAFFGLPVFLAASILLLLTATLGIAASDSLARHLPASRRTLRASTLLALGSVFLFWALRSQHLLLGDAIPIVSDTLQGMRLHHLEPGASLLQHASYVVLSPLFPTAAYNAHSIAWYSLALSSAIAGGAFVFTVHRIALLITPGTPPSSMRALLVSLAVLFQGYIQLFFGYVEHYSYLLVAIGIYVLLAVRYLRGTAPIILPGLAFVACSFVHFSGLILLPSLVFLAFRPSVRTPRRHTVSAIVVIAIVVVALAGWLRALSPGYSPAASLAGVVETILLEMADRARSIGSAEIVNLLNEGLLIGPVALPLYFLGLAGALQSKLRDSLQAFLVIAPLPYIALLLLAGPSNLGAARNWDLLAPAGFLLALPGLNALVQVPARVSALVIICLVSLYHSSPWIAVNASEDLAIQRMAALPLGGGRAKSTIGYWLALRGRTDEAEAWLTESVAESPQNVRAHLFLGHLYKEGGKLDSAQAAYERALLLRPDLKETHVYLLDVHFRMRNLDRARSHLVAVATMGRGDPVFDRLQEKLSSNDTAPVSQSDLEDWAELVQSAEKQVLVRGHDHGRIHYEQE